MYSSALANVLNHASFIKSFYINYGFKIYILLKTPTTSSYFMRCSLPHLCADGWLYLPFLWSRGRLAGISFVYGDSLSQRCKSCKIKAIDEVCIKKENFRLFPGTVMSTILVLKYTWNICLARNEIHSCTVFLQPQQIQAFQTEVRKKDKIITIVWNLTFVNKLINISMLK